MTSKVSHERVNELLAYDEESGHLTWKIKPSKKVHKGKRAGFLKKNGYRGITIEGKSYLEHHVVWFIKTGYWTKEIDHINHHKDDNSWDNIREVTHSENSRNMKRVENNTGIQGIYYDRNTDKYVSHIRLDGKKVFQKTYDESQLEEAIKEREAKLLELGFHENHGK